MRWLLLLIPMALVAQPLQRGNVDLRVAFESRIASEEQWRTSWGDFSKDYLNSGVLEITLRQIGGGDPVVLVQWYFIGHDLGRKELFIYDSGEFTGSIVRGGVKLLPYSKELVANRERMLGSNQLSGAEPWGWCVIVSQNGRRLEEKASTYELIKWTLDNRGVAPPVSRAKKAPLRFIPQALGTR